MVPTKSLSLQNRQIEKQLSNYLHNLKLSKPSYGWNRVKKIRFKLIASIAVYSSGDKSPLKSHASPRSPIINNIGPKPVCGVKISFESVCSRKSGLNIWRSFKDCKFHWFILIRLHRYLYIFTVSKKSFPILINIWLHCHLQKYLSVSDMDFYKTFSMVPKNNHYSSTTTGLGSKMQHVT